MHPKHDTAKAPLAELPWLALTLVAHAIRLGRAANGYEQHAWRRQPIELSRLLSAALRHVAAFLGGQDFDTSGAHHLACAAFNVLAALELHASCAGVDDRLERGDAPRGEAPRAEAAEGPRDQEARRYGLAPHVMDAVRALRVWVEQALRPRITQPTELADLEPGMDLPGEPPEHPKCLAWVATFTADTEAKKEALRALGLYGRQWSSWHSHGAAQAAALEGLNQALEQRLQAPEALRGPNLPERPADPLPLEGASAPALYDLTPEVMDGVRALRVATEETTGRRIKDPPEFAEIHAGGATLCGMACDGVDRKLWISRFPADNEDKRKALDALGLFGKQWSSWTGPAESAAVAHDALRRALDHRRRCAAAAKAERMAGTPKGDE